MSNRNNKFKILGPRWKDKFELPDGSYSVMDIPDFEYIMKKHETVIKNLPIRIYINKIENRIFLEIETGYCLEPLTLETVKLPGSIENKIIKDKKHWKCASFRNWWSIISP